MSQRISKIMTNYKQRDFEALLSIYNYRCLSFEQIYSLHYKMSVAGNREVGPNYLNKKMAQFKKDGLIEESTHINSNVPVLYSLTADGIKCLKEYFGFSDNIYNADKKQVQKGYLTYSEVRVAYRLMPHQYNLNLFTLGTKELFDKYYIKNQYLDEKHIPTISNIRPDAITITDKFDIYYEMDMGNETKKQLIEKWDHYRNYLKSPSNNPEKKKFILFICDEKNYSDNRIEVIKDSISHYFIDCIGKNVEFYIGTHKKLMAIVKTKIIQDYFNLDNALCNDLRTALIKSNFQVADGKQLQTFFDENPFLYYIKSTKGEHDYMVEEFFGEPLSTINKAIFYNNMNQGYYNYYKKNIPLLIVATSEEIILKNCDLFNIRSENVYFSTIRRLEELPFHSAIFKVEDGNMLSFDNSFSNFVKSISLEE